MNQDQYFFAVWTTGLMAVVTGVILYQHWAHTSAVVATIAGAVSASSAPGVATEGARPGQQGGATGIISPLGPADSPAIDQILYPHLLQ